MKTFITFLILTFFSVPAFADTWCEWDGTTGINPQSDNRGYILIEGRPTRTPSIANAAGWYKVVVTQPTIGVDQIKYDEVWGFAANEISKTWTVRDLTAEELDQREAGAMPLSEYYLWWTLIETGLITQQQAANHLPQELIDAYQARDRLENP